MPCGGDGSDKSMNEVRHLFTLVTKIEIGFVPHTVHKTNSQHIIDLNVGGKTLSFTSSRHSEYFNGLR